MGAPGELPVRRDDLLHDDAEVDNGPLPEHPLQLT
jgi:hypothetical protein